MPDEKTTAVAEPAKRFEGSTLPALTGFSHALEPKNMEETIRLANLLATSDLIPKDFQGKPANVVVAITLGRELGLSWAQAVQNIAVINGRPTIWGDAVMGIVLASNVYENSSDEWDPKLDGGTAIFRSKRKNKSETVRTFSHEDAKKAGLLDKDTYRKYERRMLFNRARAYALRDDYADVLKGLRVKEEEDDIITLVEQPSGTFGMPPRPSERGGDRTPAPSGSATLPPESTDAGFSLPKDTPAPAAAPVEKEKSKGALALVESVSETEINDVPVWVIRVAGGKEKLHTKDKEIGAAAKAVAGKQSEGLYLDNVEKRDGKMWLLEASLSS